MILWNGILEKERSDSLGIEIDLSMNARTNLSTLAETDPQKLHLWARVSMSYYPLIHLVPILTPRIANVTWTGNQERCTFDLRLSSTAFAFDGKAGSISSDSMVWDVSNSTMILLRSKMPNFESKSNVTIEGWESSRSRAKLDRGTWQGLCQLPDLVSSDPRTSSLTFSWKSANKPSQISSRLGDIRLGTNLENLDLPDQSKMSNRTSRTISIESMLKNLWKDIRVNEPIENL